MDSHQFDRLTRAFASGIDRRALLKMFGGATVAGVAGVSVQRAPHVLAQGTVLPGEVCQTSDDCLYGDCIAQSGADSVCSCLDDPSRPWIGCPCNLGEDGACGGGTPTCCTPNADDPPGTAGSCISPMATCHAQDGQCSDLQTSCEETGCCVHDTECGSNGWCNACVTGTDDACAGVNEAFGTDYICCMYGDEVGALGLCVAESDCIVQPPNTGAGTVDSASNWIAPAAAIGAAAAVLAYKSRDNTAETDA